MNVFKNYILITCTKKIAFIQMEMFFSQNIIGQYVESDETKILTRYMCTSTLRVCALFIYKYINVVVKDSKQK